MVGHPFTSVFVFICLSIESEVGEKWRIWNFCVLDLEHDVFTLFYKESVISFFPMTLCSFRSVCFWPWIPLIAESLLLVGFHFNKVIRFNCY